MSAVPAYLLVTAALVLALTVVLTPLATLTMRGLRVLDRPSARSSHTRPTPRGGGLAPAVAVAVAGGLLLSRSVGSDALGLWTGLMVCAVGFGLLGLVEDVLGVEPLPRFLCQLVIAAGAVPWLLSAPLYSGAVPRIVAGVVVVLWLVSYANCFNFMDGINGISGVSVLVAGLAWAVVGTLQQAPVLTAGSLLLAAAALGFLPFNFPRPMVFLGDAGSYFFGAGLGALLVVGLVEGVPAPALAAPLILPLADTATTLVRRLRRREEWYRPHKDHAYQRLVALGWSHARTTAVFGLLLGACALLGLAFVTAPRPVRPVAVPLLLVVAGCYLAAPHLVLRSRLSAGVAPLPEPPPAAAPKDAADAVAAVREELQRGVRR